MQKEQTIEMKAWIICNLKSKQNPIVHHWLFTVASKINDVDDVTYTLRKQHFVVATENWNALAYIVL